MTAKFEDGIFKVRADGDFVPLEPVRHIKHWDKLLQDIANGLLEWELYGEKAIDRFHVEFIVQNETYDFTLVQALDALANDKHCDERGDWSEATSAKVEVL